MKKILTFIVSVIMCASAVIPIGAGANLIIFTGDSLDSAYERCIELEEYLETNKEIYKSKNLNANKTYSYLYSECLGVYGSFAFYDSKFILSEEECVVLSIFLSEKYPEVKMTSTVKDTKIIDGVETIIHDVSLAFGDDVSEDKQFEMLKEIKSATGFTCEYLYLMSTVNVKILGDLSSDNALTPVDASMLLSYYADAQSGVAVASAESDVDYSVLGDFNNDGAVTPSDAAEILEYYADQQTGQ